MPLYCPKEKEKEKENQNLYKVRKEKENKNGLCPKHPITVFPF